MTVVIHVARGSLRPVADIQRACQSVVVKQTAEQIGADWIAYARLMSDASDQVKADGMSMLELPEEQPEFAWLVIKHVLNQYSEEDLLVNHQTEAQKVIGLVAAGPIEDLLQHHGSDFIDRIETEASSDLRLQWALRGMYQTTTDEIWARVRAASGERSD